MKLQSFFIRYVKGGVLLRQNAYEAPNFLPFYYEHHFLAVFLYTKLKIRTDILISAENPFDIIIIQSSFLIPYTIHNIKPAIKVISIITEIPSAFFSLFSLIRVC